MRKSHPLLLLGLLLIMSVSAQAQGLLDAVEKKHEHFIKINGQYHLYSEFPAADPSQPPIGEYNEFLYSTWVNINMIETVTAIKNTALHLTLVSGQELYVGFAGDENSTEVFEQKVKPITIGQFAQWLQ